MVLVMMLPAMEVPLLRLETITTEHMAINLAHRHLHIGIGITTVDHHGLSMDHHGIITMVHGTT